MDKRVRFLILGRACKSLALRLLITPPDVSTIGKPSDTVTEITNEDPVSCVVQTTADAGTQTTLSFPVHSNL